VSVCRLSFQVEGGEGSDIVDIALPAGTPVCILLPGIVSLFDPTAEPDTVVDDWRLDRLCGTPVDDWMTLAENGIRDGELMILTSRATPRLGPLQWDPCRTVAVTDPPSDDTAGVGAASCVWAAITASVALAWAGAGAHDWSHLIVAAAASCAAAITAIANRGVGPRVAAVAFASATGVLAVPSTPSAASAFLAASAGLSMSLLMLRSAMSAVLVATVTLSGLVAVAAVGPVIGTVSTSAVGATMVAASLGVLAIAPRTAILASGLRPDDHPDDCGARATFAHVTLTGLVVGCACGAAIGVVVVALGCRRPDPPALAGVAFTAVVGLALSLRGRSHADTPRRIALVVSGLCCFTASFAIAVAAAPSNAGWPSAVVIAVGLAALRRHEVGPAMARAVELLEYAVLAAAVPLACWVGGVYAIARESHLL
jgi:type VII secretion integral membrane protein EccD